MEAFLNSIILTINDNDLPIEASKLWSEHIYPCRNPDHELDLKESSYKKLGKFLAHCDKLDLIKYKESSKKSNNPSVIEINKNHQLLTNWDTTVSFN